MLEVVAVTRKTGNYDEYQKNLSRTLRSRGVSSLKSLQYGLKIAEEKSGVKINWLVTS